MNPAAEEQSLGAFLAETLDHAFPFPEMSQVHCLAEYLVPDAEVVLVLLWEPDQVLQLLFPALG